MNGFYDMLLFLFVLGAATQGFNELGVFDMTAPDSNIVAPGETEVQELQDGAAGSGVNEFTMLQTVMSFGKVLGMGFMAMFTIIPLAVTWLMAIGLEQGLSFALAGFLQVPITFVTIFGLYEFWTGRSVT
jgi:hypothetical protein